MSKSRAVFFVSVLVAMALVPAAGQAQHMQHHQGLRLAQGPAGQWQTPYGMGNMMGYGNMPMMGYGMGNMPMMGYGNMPMMGYGMGNMPMMGYGMGNMPMMGYGNMPMMGYGTTAGDVNTYADTRATYLKAQLGITEGQATVWNGYVSAFRAHLTAMQQHQQGMLTSMTAGTTSAQRAEALVASMDACHKAMKDLKTAYVALYQALTPDQKQRADAIFAGMNWMM
jgi:hypothetical protein